MVLLWLNQ